MRQIRTIVCHLIFSTATGIGPWLKPPQHGKKGIREFKLQGSCQMSPLCFIIASYGIVVDIMPLYDFFPSVTTEMEVFQTEEKERK